MLCAAFFVCLVIVWRRRARGTTILVPVLVMILSLIRLVMLVASLHAMKAVSPAEESAVFAVSIDDSVKSAAFGLVYELPLLALAWVVDRRQRQRDR